jgi:hypothetical protein
MIPKERARQGATRRRDLIKRYIRLQVDLSEADPLSSTYQATIHAFRQIGYALITSGFEDDLDRLLRFRVLDGGRAISAPRERNAEMPELHVVERRQKSAVRGER